MSSMDKTNLGVALVTGASTGIGRAPRPKRCRRLAFAYSVPAVAPRRNNPTV
jgi:NADP-dependent 3-hydroxy acid dehydrogenase YdfG